MEKVVRRFSVDPGPRSCRGESSKTIGQKGRQACLGEDIDEARFGETISKTIGQTAVRRAS